MVNPYISNRQRAEVLGHNLFGHLWKADAARIMGINREALYSRLAKPDGDLDDAEINLLMAEARRRIKELETAAELCRPRRLSCSSFLGRLIFDVFERAPAAVRVKLARAAAPIARDPMGCRLTVDMVVAGHRGLASPSPPHAGQATTNSAASMHAICDRAIACRPYPV